MDAYPWLSEMLSLAKVLKFAGKNELKNEALPLLGSASFLVYWPTFQAKKQI